MATIRKEFRSPRPAAEVWDALRDFPSVHKRLARGFVVATHMEGPGVRVVTFANGAEAREWLVTCDDTQRRLVYAIKDLPGYTHYSAAAQVFEDAEGQNGSRFVWTVDFLPDSMAKQQDGLMDMGAEAMRQTLA